ncbi:PIN domain-containing protein [Bacillus tuaregi]|uniref:PIN domain-containing protein n=1 Tax=Bacillus tuaregi TaxID=1816695 RepID=UPI000B01C916|nr:PIN domain-containing protein [Bacillus tuaregi]
MNSSRFTSPIVLFDTTVLCGAIRSPGINRELLKLAAQTVDYRVVISRVCLMEFMRKATYDGIGDVIYTKEMVEKFLDLFVYPILENSPAVNSVVGRHHWEIVRRNEMKIGQALAEISGLSLEEAILLAEEQGLQKPLRIYDEQDVHIWVTAIQEKCSFIVTNNTKRFPEAIGEIKRIKPGQFYNLFVD